MRFKPSTTQIDISAPYGRVLPLLPRHHVNLSCGSREDGQRFAILFTQVWNVIPFGARRRMLKHWKDARRRLGGDVRLIPIISLHTEVYSRNHASGGLWGAVFDDGLRVEFSSHFVNQLSDDDVQYLVAHELAHVIQYAAGWTDFVDEFGTSMLTPLGDELDRDEVEMDADEIAAEWGFVAPDLRRDVFRQPNDPLARQPDRTLPIEQ